MTQEKHSSIIESAVAAYELGYTPIPIRTGEKRPTIPSWSSISYDTIDEVLVMFKDINTENIGLALGEASGGLVDVDLDHPKALRLRDLFLPPTPMVSGRASARRSHYWYIATDGLPEGTRRYKMPDGSVSVELRSTGGQTLIHPTIARCSCTPQKKGPWCKDGGHLFQPEPYLWEGEPFGGEQGPTREHGQVLSARVATLAMACVLVDGWPMRGGRHEAYLALAGGLLRYGTADSVSVHPLWETALPNFIKALAQATDDEDGPETRASEVMGSTMDRLRQGKTVQGFPTLAKIIGTEHADLVRTYAREIETLLGHASRPAPEPMVTEIAGEVEQEVRILDLENRSPLDERTYSWEPVDLGPYLEGRIDPVVPGILYRTDGMGLFYPGRVNCLYGRSESGKTWLTLTAAKDLIEAGGTVMYVDLEDDPEQTLIRLRALNTDEEAIRRRFHYIHPESPISRLLVNRWGEKTSSPEADGNQFVFNTALDSVQPNLLIVDGLSVLYGLHGLDTNSTTDTEKITGWMKALTDHGRRTVILIDHTVKNAGLGATPLGSQHKVAMIQGVALQVHPITRPVRGRVGDVVLAVGKDRLGYVRSASVGDDPQIAAEVTLDGRTEGRMMVTIAAPNPGTVIIGDSPDGSDPLAKMAEQQDRMLDVLREDRDGEMTGLTQNVLLKAAGGSRASAQKILDSLIKNGHVERERHGKSLAHRLVSDPYDLSSDDHS